LYRESAECKRCGSTTVYTNEVEFNLWRDRPGCPACYKAKQVDEFGDETELDREAPIAFEPIVTVNGVEVRVLRWEVLTDDEGRDTGRRLIGIELP